jgi:alkylhydroperoxidase family enzyme
MPARIAPAEQPFAASIQARLDRLMPPGVPPLRLFTTLARDERLFEKFMSGGLLDRGNLTLRQREIMINRTTALCGSEYEWGVHVALFAGKAGLTREQVHATVHGDADAPCWTENDRLLIQLCDVLHRTCDVDDQLWSALETSFTPEALLELLMLAGFYRTVSYLTKALRLPVETGVPTFPPC